VTRSSLVAPTPACATAPAWRARLLAPGDEGAWEQLLLHHGNSRAIVPTWDELAGWTTQRIGLFAGEGLAGGLVMAVRRIPRLPLFLSRITCVMVDPARAGEMLAILLAEVDRYCRRHLIVETELRLRIPASDNLDGFGDHRDLRGVLEAFGYRALPKVDATYVVRIDRDDEALLASFVSTTRNRIKKAKQLGAVVSTSADPGLMEQFYEAYTEMGARKHAPVPRRTFVVQGLKALIDRGHALLFTERYGGQVANMLVVDALGLPCYMIGTRSVAHVKGDVPGAAQMLHFEIMKYLRDRGKTYYDLGGCEGPEPIESHPNFGVWRFKHGFRGAFVQFLPYFRKMRGPTRLVLEVVHQLRGDPV
jgi:hypothetical protein